MQVPFSPPRMDQKSVDAVAEVLASGWITTGPKVQQFEGELNAFFDAQEVVCVNAATSGLELILRWFGVGEGDEVILPAYTYCATANVVLHCGAVPVLVDVNERDFNLNLEQVKAKITSKTKVIMPVDMGGMPCDYAALNALVREEEVRALFTPQTEEQTELGRILILADAAHSIGARLDGRPSGSLTDVSVFSFHAVKNLTTAEGGAIALNFEQLDNTGIKAKLKRNSLHGQTKDALAKTKAGGWRYDILEPGYKCNMTDIQAAIGLVELERYQRDTLTRRREIMEGYNQAFADCSWAVLPQWEDDKRLSSFHLYMLRISGVTEEQRDEVIQFAAERGVATNVHFIPLPLLTLYKNKGYKMEDYPVAFKNYTQEISLPVYYNLTAEQQRYVIHTITEAVEQVCK